MFLYEIFCLSTILWKNLYVNLSICKFNSFVQTILLALLRMKVEEKE